MYCICWYISGATAGMRLLELEHPDQTSQLIGNVSEALAESDFQFTEGDAQILPGQTFVQFICLFEKGLPCVDPSGAHGGV